MEQIIVHRPAASQEKQAATAGMPVWKIRASRVEIDRTLLEFWMEVFDLGDRLEQWEHAVPEKFSDQAGKEIGKASCLLNQLDDAINELLQLKMDYDILHSGE